MVENHFVYEKVLVIESCLGRLVEMLENDEIVMWKVKIEWAQDKQEVLINPSKKQLSDIFIWDLKE